ncbi:hypothetical protein GOODEAATRI_023447 [Goodea atripinnis]|uniref:Sushi domain-containing protein n=1 Tax=Goodea atripinnis TaxID=208336 RepID=A0ABV0PGD3_9TELE
MQFLHALPLNYNYALYRDIFQRFGTHYYSSGKLGGHYDLLYQYSREELKSSGGRAREAGALAWERQGPAPDKTSYKNWAKSVLDNPALVDYKKSKQYYSFGEDEEFQCFTGFELEGFQFINCRPDGTWSPLQGRCIRKLCVGPEVPENMELYPAKASYRVGEVVGFNCNETGLMPMPRGTYRCSSKLTWEPPLPADLRCTDEQPFVPDGPCGPGQRLQGSSCVCIKRESCLSQLESLCILNGNLDVTVSMSLCSFHAGRCHGDPLFFITKGVCDSVDPSTLEWAKFRAKMSSRSSLHVPCNLDTCYDWETCSGEFV